MTKKTDSRRSRCREYQALVNGSGNVIKPRLRRVFGSWMCCVHPAAFALVKTFGRTPDLAYREWYMATLGFARRPE